MKTDIFAKQSTCMEVSVSLSCLFVHEPPYQTTVVCCNAVFRRGSSRMDHRTVFHVRAGLAQARPNKGGQVTKPIIVVKICYKLLYVIQVVKKIFDK